MWRLLIENVNPNLVVIGHIMIETIYLSNGKVIGPVLGSPAAYSSVAASSLRTRTGLATVVGKDMPFYIVNPIIETGVETKGICIKGKTSRSMKLSYDKDGNKKVSYEKVAPHILIKDIPKEYLKSKAFFICPIDFEVPIETIFNLKKLNKLMMTGLGGHGGTVSTIHPSTGSKEDKKVVRDIASNFNIIKTSIEDGLYLFEDSVSPEEAIKMIHKWGAEVVILTLGGKGSLISNNKDILEIPAVKEKIKVDATGAGDVYCAAFLSEYLRTEDLYKSGLFASAAATILIEKTGGVPISRMPTKKSKGKNKRF